MPSQDFSFKHHAFILGSYPITGWADGTALSIEFPEDWTVQVGAGGAVTFSTKNDPTAKATLRLQATSPDNDFLTALAATDRATGLGKVPFFVKALRGGRDIVAAAEARITKRPNLEFSEEGGNREWQLTLVDVDTFSLPI